MKPLNSILLVGAVAFATALVTVGVIYLARRTSAEEPSDAAMLIAVPTARSSARAAPSTESAATTTVSSSAPSASVSPPTLTTQPFGAPKRRLERLDPD